jgi:hypothetical protein
MQELNVVVNNQKYQREYIYNNVSILNTQMESYIVNIPKNITSEMNINTRISSQLMEFLRHNQNTLFKESIKVYNDSIDNDFPIRPFESILKYYIPYNEQNFISNYRDDYQFTGGAHGNTIRKSDTWDIISGRLLPLYYFFPNNPNYKETILEEIQLQAKANMEANTGIYFDDYKELIAKYFNVNNYYLISDGIAIYYQQYDIAPYSTGIVVFELPFSCLTKKENDDIKE